MTKDENNNAVLAPLESLVANTCFCKLKEKCEDKNSTECMRERNIYAEFMAQKNSNNLS
jgi:hypothetical protein